MATTGIQTIGTDQNLGNLLRTWKPKLTQVLGESEEAAGRFLAVVEACVRRNPDLKSCTVDSFRTAIENAAALKLLPTGLMNLGWIIPFGKDATFIVGYRGLLDIVYRSKKVAGYNAGLVHKDDHWRYVTGLNTVLEHEPKHNGLLTYDNRADLVAGYATWWDVIDGHPVAQRHIVLNHAQLERLRMKSKKADSGPWKTDYEPMVLKAIVRASMKLMPLTSTEDALLARSYEVEDEHLGLGAIDIDPEPETKPEPKSGRESMFDDEEN